MEDPSNAVYGKDDAPPPKYGPVTFLGIRIPQESRPIVAWTLLALLIVMVTIIVFLLPSGIPFLAAKNSGGFFGYVGLFFLYMIGFFVILSLFFTTMYFVGDVTRRAMTEQA